MTPLPASEPVLTLDGVARAYEPGHWIFRGLNLHLRRGERLALVGPSGSGKSTLLNLVAGLDRPDEGEVRVAGQRLADLDEAGRARLRRDATGFVFQAFHLINHLTLWQNVAVPLLLQGVPLDEARERAAALLTTLGLGGRDSASPLTLSGGEQQRVALARAIIHRPLLVLADEPTGNLDPETAALALAVLDEQAARHGAALLLVTHSEQAAAIADRRLRLSPRGLVEADHGSPLGH